MAFFLIFSSLLAIIYLYSGFRLIPFIIPKKILRSPCSPLHNLRINFSRAHGNNGF